MVWLNVPGQCRDLVGSECYFNQSVSMTCVRLTSFDRILATPAFARDRH